MDLPFVFQKMGIFLFQIGKIIIMRLNVSDPFEPNTGYQIAQTGGETASPCSVDKESFFKWIQGNKNEICTPAAHRGQVGLIESGQAKKNI